MTNRFDKFSDTPENNDTKTNIAEEILNAGKDINVLDIEELKMPIKPKNSSKSYYMRSDIHEKIVELAKSNDVGPSEFLEYVLIKILKIED